MKVTLGTFFENASGSESNTVASTGRTRRDSVVCQTIGKRRYSCFRGVSGLQAVCFLEIGSAILRIVGRAGEANCTMLGQDDFLRVLVQVPICSSFSGLEKSWVLFGRHVWYDQIRSGVDVHVRENDCYDGCMGGCCMTVNGLWLIYGCIRTEFPLVMERRETLRADSLLWRDWRRNKPRKNTN